MWIGGQAVPGALLAGVVGVAATLQAGRSRRAETRGLVATIWIILALTLHDTGVGALEYSVAFAVGGAAGAGLAWSRARSGSADGSGADEVEAGATPSGLPTFGALPANPLGRFVVLRGIGLGVAVLLGFTWFPAHPAWVAITALIVMRPPTRHALVVGLQRSLGTGLGVVVAVAVGQNQARPGSAVPRLGLPHDDRPRGELRPVRHVGHPPEGKVILVWATAQSLLGTLVYRWLEGWSPIDALYFSVVTLATVGYGDLHPTTEAAKLFTVLYILFGFGVLAAFISELTKHSASVIARLRPRDDPSGPAGPAGPAGCPASADGDRRRPGLTRPV